MCPVFTGHQNLMAIWSRDPLLYKLHKIVRVYHVGPPARFIHIATLFVESEKEAKVEQLA